MHSDTRLTWNHRRAAALETDYSNTPDTTPRVSGTHFKACIVSVSFALLALASTNPLYGQQPLNFMEIGVETGYGVHQTAPPAARTSVPIGYRITSVYPERHLALSMTRISREFSPGSSRLGYNSLQLEYYPGALARSGVSGYLLGGASLTYSRAVVNSADTPGRILVGALWGAGFRFALSSWTMRIETVGASDAGVKRSGAAEAVVPSRKTMAFRTSLQYHIF